MNSAIKDRIDKIGQGIVPEGYKETKVGIIPNDWEVMKLKDVSDRIIEKNNGKTNNVLTISANDGLVNQENYFTKQIASKNLDNYTYLIKGNFAYNKSYSKGYPLGAIKKLELYEDGVVSSLYICFRAKENISETYLQHYFYANMFNKEISNIAQEGARNHGLLNIGISDFFSIELELPPYQEQEKIADILSTWDKAIENIGKLIKGKEIQKNGLMQQLLTGKTRLPGFNDKWKRVKLGEICNYISSGITKNRVDYGKYAVYGSMGIIGYSSKYDYEGTKILIARVGANAGYINIVDEKYGVSDNTLVVDLKLDSIDYIYYYLKLFNINKLVFGTGQPLITGGDVKEIEILLPPLEERNAIADILSTADKQIELLNQLLTNIKEEKKGLMQLLLTGIVRV